MQLGKAAGARVVAVVGGPDKAEVARRCGADVVVDRHTEDVVSVVKEVTGGRGADVVFDPVGGDAYAQSTKCVAFEGRIVVVGFASGTHAVATARPRPGEELLDPRPALGALRPARPGPGPGRARELVRLVAEGAIAPVVGERVRLRRARRRRAAAGRRVTVGRVVWEA